MEADIDILLALSCAGVSAAALAFIAARGAIGASGGVRDGVSPLHAVLSVPALLVARRRLSDQELNRAVLKFDRLVAQAGGRFMDGATAEEVFAARFVFPAFGIAAVVPVCLALGFSGFAAMLAALGAAVLLYAYPESSLKAAAEERARRFTHDLPGALDVMRIVAESGGDLLSAIRSVIDVTSQGPVREELSRAVAEVGIGTSLAQSLNNVAARVNTNEANAVFSTLAQSLEMGTSVSENLKSAAQLIRHSARVKAQAQAQKAVVNMSFPLLLLILPGIFIVLFAPLVIQFFNK
jgi:Flp pilus assembly protein TadB